MQVQDVPEPGEGRLTTWQDAEVLATEHMRRIGFVDAVRTAPGTDAGLDVRSAEAVAQVKFYGKPVGRPDVQQLRGAAHGYLLPLFYSASGYTDEARRYADTADVALFLMRPDGSCTPVSVLAESLVMPHLLAERQAKADQLAKARFELVVLALRSKLELCSRFGELVELGGSEGAIFAHVMSDCYEAIEALSDATHNRLEVAEGILSSIEKQIDLLRLVAGEALLGKEGDTSLDYEGWKVAVP